jgi:hypothetical protein
MKKIILFTIALTAYLNIQAQVKLALTGGVNLNSISWKDKDDTNVKTDSSDFKFNSTGQKQGFTVGLLLNIKTEENWVLETGLVYTQKGGTTKESTTLRPTNINFSRTQTFAPAYLQLPLYLMYKSESRKKYKLIMGLGGYIGTGVGGKYNSVTTLGSSTNVKLDRNAKFGTALSDDFFNTEIGVGAKIGFLMSENLAFGVNYQRSISNNIPMINRDFGSAAHNTVSFTITKYVGR